MLHNDRVGGAEGSPPAASEDFGPTIIDIPADLSTLTGAAAATAATAAPAEVPPPSAPARKSKARDVVVMSSTAADEAGAVPGPGEERTMGQVYPIMKNTIYEDELCAAEVHLGALDCGARFIRYVDGLFQYLVRNPKTMGFLLTTAVLLLFFKYSQQIVVQSVRYALASHPGLEPSDELRSGVTAFTTEMRGFESVARTLEWAYLHDNITGYDPATIASSTFMALAASLQRSFIANEQTFVLYRIPAAVTATGKAQWGQIGCLNAGGNLGDDPLCLYTAANGTAVGFRGSNTSDIIFSRPDQYADGRIKSLAQLEGITADSPEAASGVWSPPMVFQDPFYNATFRVIGYTLPIKFVAASAFVFIDVSVRHMAAAVTSSTPNKEVIIADNRYLSREGGQFVLDTFDTGMYWPDAHAVTATPSERVNEVTRAVQRRRDGPGMPANGSFYEDGLVYESLTMMDRWSLIASSPMVLSAAEVVAAFRSLLDSYEHVTSSASAAFVECQQSAEAQRDNTFIEAIGRIEETFGSRVHSLYVVYVTTPSDDGNGGGPTDSDSSTNIISSSSSSTDDGASHVSTIGSSSTGDDKSDVGEASTATTTSSSTHDGLESSSDAATLPSHVSASTDRESFTDAPLPPSYSSSSDAGKGSDGADTGERPHGELSESSPSGAHDDGEGGEAFPELLPAAGRVERLAAAGGDGAAESWGSCGCSYGARADAGFTCFYTDGKGVETLFDGAKRSNATKVETLNFNTSRRQRFIEDAILAANTTEGFWTRPYSSFDTLTDVTINAMSYVLPFRFDAAGAVTAAAVFDLTMDWISAFLSEHTHRGTTGVILVDRRGDGTFMGSRSFVAGHIYAAMATPNQTVNDLTASVHRRAGETFERSISFHDGPRLVNYQLIEPYWGIIEQIPADVALDRFLPTPTVTGATDALRLIPTHETIELFLYIAGILFFYFLNLLILGCSKLGRQAEKPQPPQAAPVDPPPQPLQQHPREGHREDMEDNASDGLEPAAAPRRQEEEEEGSQQ